MAFSVCIDPDVWEILISCSHIEVELCVANGTGFSDRSCKKWICKLHFKVTYEIILKSDTLFFF